MYLYVCNAISLVLGKFTVSGPSEAVMGLVGSGLAVAGGLPVAVAGVAAGVLGSWARPCRAPPPWATSPRPARRQRGIDGDVPGLS